MKRYSIFLSILIVFMIATWSSATTVATGKKDGGYHNKFYNLMVSLGNRIGGEDAPDFEYYSDKGTDGSAQNVKLVGAGKSDIGYSQLGATVIGESDNITPFGPIAFELAHLVVPKKGKIGSCDDIEKKGVNIGVNTMSGSMVTLKVMGEVDKDFKKLTPVDTTRGSIALTKMDKGEIDGFFFVSVPGTKNIKRLANKSHVKFANCWDSDFNDYMVNDTELYTKVKIGKKDAVRMGYPKQKLTTFRVPTYLIVNNDVLEENEDLYDFYTDLASAMYNHFKSQPGASDYYPSK